MATKLLFKNETKLGGEPGVETLARLLLIEMLYGARLVLFDAQLTRQ